MNEDELYDAAEREMDLYRAEITRITAALDETRDKLRETAADNIALRKQVDDFTRAVINVSARPVLTALATDLRKRTGLPS